MTNERESDLVDLIRLRLRKGARLDHFEVHENKRDRRWVAQVADYHTHIDKYVSHFACSSVSMEDALSKLLERLSDL